LEQIIEMALPQFAAMDDLGTGMPEREHSLVEDDGRSQEDQEAIGGAFQSGKWYGHSASGSIAPVTVLEQVRSSRVNIQQ
jgi:hypothetical protein